MAKTITLAAADLATGETAKMREFKFTPDGGSETTVKVLATDAITIPAKPPSEEGVTVVTSIKEFRVNGSKLELVLGTANSITGVAGADITKEITLTVVDLVSDTSYDGTGKKFVQTKKSATVLAAGEGANWDVVSLVSHASQHVEG